MGRRTKGLNFGTKRERKINTSLVQEVVVWTLEICIAVVMAFVLNYFFCVRSSVIGPSMSTQLEDGDEVLIDRFSYKFISPKPGDVIAFLPNGNTNTHYYVKRIIGTPGDRVRIEEGVVYVNGEEFQEKIAVSQIEDAGIAADEVVLGEDEYFVLGDNRNNSEDSRFANIGNVKESYILGKVWFIAAPGDKIGLIK